MNYNKKFIKKANKNITKSILKFNAGDVGDQTLV